VTTDRRALLPVGIFLVLVGAVFTIVAGLYLSFEFGAADGLCSAVKLPAGAATENGGPLEHSGVIAWPLGIECVFKMQDGTLLHKSYGAKVDSVFSYASALSLLIGVVLLRLSRKRRITSVGAPSDPHQPSRPNKRERHFRILLTIALAFSAIGLCASSIAAGEFFENGGHEPFEYCYEHDPPGVPDGPSELGPSFTWQRTIVPFGLKCIYFGNAEPLIVFHDNGTWPLGVGLLTGLAAVSFGAASIVSLLRAKESTTTHPLT
jgi:hypothetical protein